MGLLPSDKIPPNVSFRDAYSKIREWCQANVEIPESRNDEYGNRGATLTKALPLHDNLSDLEIQAVLGEVIYGNLEWAYHQDDGAYKMAAYAQGALEATGLSFVLSSDEKAKLQDSPLWTHLTLSRE